MSIVPASISQPELNPEPTEPTYRRVYRQVSTAAQLYNDTSIANRERILLSLKNLTDSTHRNDRLTTAFALAGKRFDQLPVYIRDELEAAVAKNEARDRETALTGKFATE